MVEKRKFTRFALGTEIRWKREVYNMEASHTHMGHTRDISAGGFCLDMIPEISIGDTLLLEIKLSGDRTIYSKGRVAWVNSLAQIKGWIISSCEGGIELLNLNNSDQRELDNFASQSFQN